MASAVATLMKSAAPRIRIQQATLDHLPDLVPLFDGYRQFYQQSSDVLGAQTFLANRLAHGESVIFIAYQQDTSATSGATEVSVDNDSITRAVGFTQLYPSYSSVSLQRLWILNDLYVELAARGHGVASALMQRAEDLATQTGAKGLVLETAVDNRAAQALYERRHWQRETDGYMYTFKCQGDAKSN